MNRGLMALMMTVAGLSIYMSTQSDDDLLAPTRQANARSAHSADRSPLQTRQKASQIEPWLANSLTQGVQQWQARLTAEDPVPARAVDWVMWRSMQPPPPPVPPRVATVELPPPTPVAPRFPHSWVGRFNDEIGDESVAVAASSASPPVAPRKVVRAVLAGPQNTWVVRAGDVIDGQWRVDRIQDRTMSLTYLPLQQQQTVVMR